MKITQSIKITAIKNSQIRWGVSVRPEIVIEDLTKEQLMIALKHIVNDLEIEITQK